MWILEICYSEEGLCGLGTFCFQPADRFLCCINIMVKVGYEAILLLYQPSTYATADVIATYSYRLGFENGNYGLATAVGLFEALVALILVSLSNWVSRKITDNALW